MRVIAGELRGRRFRAPPGDLTRPTSDRVRESLFNLLGPLASGVRVLDLYAGSGALGIEALSRGASHATFVERARSAVVALRGNLKDLGLARRATVIPREALVGLAAAAGPFDHIFADPPYDAGDAAEIVMRASRALAPGGVLSLEHASSDPAPEPPEGLALWKSRRYGGTCVSLYVRSPEESS